MWGYAGVFPGEFNLWKGDQTLNQLKFMVENGFESTWLNVKEMKTPARRDQIAQYVTEHNLKLVLGFHAPFFGDDRDALQRATDEFLEDLRTYGDMLRTPIVTTGAGNVHRFMAKPSLAEQLDRLTEAFTPVAKGCHDLGRPFGIENHGDYYCEDLVELCKRVPHMGIFLDTGNTYLIGEQSVPACRLAAPYTIGTHFKDHLVHPDPRELKFVIQGATLGSGHVGLEEIYKDLMRLNPHPEKLVLHWELVPPKGEDPWKSLRDSWTFCRRIEKEYPPCPKK